MAKKRWVYNTHHRLPRSRGGTDEESNLIQVPSHFHEAWHKLFRNFSPELIAKICNDTWLPNDVEFIVRRKIIVVKDGRVY